MKRVKVSGLVQVKPEPETPEKIPLTPDLLLGSSGATVPPVVT